MRVSSALLVAIAMIIAPAALAQTPKITMEEMMVPSGDTGIDIYVRNKRPTDMTSFRPERTLLYVHGATYPASTAFDLPLGGQSWMEYAATSHPPAPMRARRTRTPIRRSDRATPRARAQAPLAP